MQFRELHYLPLEIHGPVEWTGAEAFVLEGQGSDSLTVHLECQLQAGEVLNVELPCFANHATATTDWLQRSNKAEVSGSLRFGAMQTADSTLNTSLWNDVQLRPRPPVAAVHQPLAPPGLLWLLGAWLLLLSLRSRPWLVLGVCSLVASAGLWLWIRNVPEASSVVRVWEGRVLESTARVKSPEEPEDFEWVAIDSALGSLSLPASSAPIRQLVTDPPRSALTWTRAIDGSVRLAGVEAQVVLHAAYDPTPWFLSPAAWRAAVGVGEPGGARVYSRAYQRSASGTWGAWGNERAEPSLKEGEIGQPGWTRGPLPFGVVWWVGQLIGSEPSSTGITETWVRCRRLGH